MLPWINRAILSAIFLVFVALVDGQSSPLVRVKFGQIRGKWTKSARNAPIASFLGIPYAEPPIAKLRFTSPRPWNHTWLEIRDGTRDGPTCIQLNEEENIVIGSEDCLYLNVFVPVSKKTELFRLPVAVYVHGGGFNTGTSNSSMYSPEYLADQGVILVTVNYRLNIFGFLSTGSEALPGNYGLKDIVAALAWVQDNIANFGGNPEAVTLFGNSAGAAATHLLALTNKTEGLFSRYIMHSGTGLATWAIHHRKTLRRSTFELAQRIGCFISEDSDTNSDDSSSTEDITAMEGKDSKEMIELVDKIVEEYLNEDDGYDEYVVECLRSAHAVDMLKGLEYLTKWRGNPWCIFGPTLEEDSEDAILTKHPLKAIDEGLFRDIPFIIGLVEDEGLLKSAKVFEHKEAQKDLVSHFNYLLPYLLEYQEVISDKPQFAHAVRDFYFDGNVGARLLRNLTQLIGDAAMNWPVIRTLNLQTEKMNSSAYFYVFSYKGTFTYLGYGPEREYGITHSDDMNYIFPVLNFLHRDRDLHNTESDWTMINVMTEMWANFMENGVPSASLTPGWPEYQLNGDYVQFGDGRSPDVMVKSNFRPARMKFWEDIMPNVSVNMVELDTEYELEEDGSATIQAELYLVSFLILASLHLIR